MIRFVLFSIFKGGFTMKNRSIPAEKLRSYGIRITQFALFDLLIDLGNNHEWLLSSQKRETIKHYFPP